MISACPCVTSHSNISMRELPRFPSPSMATRTLGMAGAACAAMDPVTSDHEFMPVFVWEGSVEQEESPKPKPPNMPPPKRLPIFKKSLRFMRRKVRRGRRCSLLHSTCSGDVFTSKARGGRGLGPWQGPAALGRRRWAETSNAPRPTTYGRSDGPRCDAHGCGFGSIPPLAVCASQS